MERTALLRGIGAGLAVGAAVGATVFAKRAAMKTCVGHTMQHMGSAMVGAAHDPQH